MKKIYSLFLAVWLVGAVSCDDFLEKNPHNDVTASESIINLDDAQVALNGMYSAFKSGSYYTRNFTAVPDIMSDEVFSVIGYSNQLGEMYKWSFTPGGGESSGAWSIMYDAIVWSSNIINVIDDLDGDADLKKRIKGEALMGRALAHFDLVKTFAKSYDPATASQDLGVPVILEYKLDEPARNTVEEVYNQVIIDAKAAKDLLSEADAHADQYDDQVTFTKFAVDALLARVYLYKKDWANAITYASNVIGSGKFELLEGDDFKNMWINDTGAEIIWKVALTPNDSDGRQIGYNYFNDAQGKPGPDYVPADWLLNMYDTKDDVRWDAYYETLETKYDGWVTTLVHKYPTNPKFTGGNSNGANMPKVFRLAEMYLIRAEAYAEKGGSDALAMADLNALRAKRIDGYADESLSGNSLKTAIWNERAMELAFEGHRFFDLKRKGLGFTRVPQENTNPGPNALSISANDHRWLWPIPQGEMNGNRNMVQNNDY